MIYTKEQLLNLGIGLTSIDKLINNEIQYIEIKENKLKLLSDIQNTENQNSPLFMFCRFNSNNTKLEGYDSNKTIQDFVEKIIRKLDYNIPYGEQRSKLVKKLIDKNNWIYDLMSTDRMINKEVKNKQSLLSENQTINKLFDMISSYINHPKFDNKKHEKVILESKGRNRNKNNNQMTEYKKKRNQNSEINIDSVEIIHQKSNMSENPIIRKSMKLDIKTDLWWDNMYKDENVKEFQKFLYNQFIKEIEYYKSRLGHEGVHMKVCNKCMDYITIDNVCHSCGKSDIHLITGTKEKKKYIRQYKNRINKNPKQYISNNKTYKIDGDRYFGILKQLYDNLMADFKVAEPLLTNQLKSPSSFLSMPNIDFSEHSWYINERGEEIEVNKKMINFGDSNSYRGLLLTYCDLCQKYDDKPQTHMWHFLRDFENIVKQAADMGVFNKYERLVLKSLLVDNCISNNGLSANLGMIKDKYDSEFDTNIDKKTIQRMIDIYIPNKLKKIYLANMEEFIFTEKLKGEYKLCNTCGTNKLINHFNKKDDKYYKSLCKECEKTKRS